VNNGISNDSWESTLDRLVAAFNVAADHDDQMRQTEVEDDPFSIDDLEENGDILGIDAGTNTVKDQSKTFPIAVPVAQLVHVDGPFLCMAKRLANDLTVGVEALIATAHGMANGTCHDFPFDTDRASRTAAINLLMDEAKRRTCHAAP